MKTLFLLPFIVAINLINSCGQKAESEIYIINQDFTGKVNILFDRKNGQAEKYEGNTRVYEIPLTGVLVSQFKANDGLTDRKYFSIDNSGKRTPLEIFEYEHDDNGNVKWVVSDKKMKGIFEDGVSGQYGSTGDPKSVQYQEFIVSNYNQLDSFHTSDYQIKFNEKIEKVTGLLLNLK